MLVFEDQVNGHATHVLVVGIGTYPFCGPNATVAAFQQVLDLTSPPVSAHEIVRHLIANKNRLAAPLATIDLLGDPVAGSEFVAPTPATFSNVRTAMRAWQARGRQGDCLLLYWCGHGFLNAADRHLLVCANAGEDGDFWQNTVDSKGAYIRSVGSRASTQLWLIDACREDSSEIPVVDAVGNPTLRDLNDHPLVLIRDKDLTKYVSSSIFAKAAGDPNEASHFCKALKQAIEWEAYSEGGQGWQIRTGELLAPINQILQRQRLVQRANITEGMGANVVWSTATPPDIPAEFWCDPVLERRQVRLELHTIDTQSLQVSPLDAQDEPDPDLQPWQKDIPAGMFIRLEGHKNGSQSQHLNLSVTPKRATGVLTWQP